MGSDGREGVVAVRGAGGRTLAEAKESAVVFGMPREAAESGAVDEVVSLAEMPQHAPARSVVHGKPGASGVTA